MEKRLELVKQVSHSTHKKLTACLQGQQGVDVDKKSVRSPSVRSKPESGIKLTQSHLNYEIISLEKGRRGRRKQCALHIKHNLNTKISEPWKMRGQQIRKMFKIHMINMMINMINSC